MTSYFNLLERCSDRRFVFAMIVALVPVAGIGLPWTKSTLEQHSTIGAGPPDLKTSYSNGELYEIFGSYGEDGRSDYIWIHLTIDAVFPFLVFILTALAIYQLVGSAFGMTSRVRALAVVPLATMVLDYLENLSLVGVASRFPTTTDWLATAASAFTTTKWITAVIGNGALVVLAIVAIANRFRSRGNDVELPPILLATSDAGERGLADELAGRH